MRIAVRSGGGYINWLLTDHLGSTAVTTNSSGAMTAELRYMPYGTSRYASGTQQTTYRYTGQRIDTTTDLYYYGSRWYDPVVGRFIQADTIVPNAGNPQDLNRYTYVGNNPLKYVDPTGHQGSGFDWVDDYNWKVRYYRSHGYEQNEKGKWVYTGNFDIPDAANYVVDKNARRNSVHGYAQDLIGNGTPVGQALVQLTAYTAAIYLEATGGLYPATFTGSFVDDLAEVFCGMSGPDILIDRRRVDHGKQSYGKWFLGFRTFPDTDLRSEYQDGSLGQARHYWFYVAVAYWNGPAVALAGNLYHEYAPGQDIGQSWEDYILGAAGANTGFALRLGLRISAVSDFIASMLIAP